MTMSQLLINHLKFEEGKKFAHPSELIPEIENVYSSLISKYLMPSPLKKSAWLSNMTRGEVWLKLESLNPNGSFKVRGALNAINNIMQKHSNNNGKIKVCTASAGNHAQGVAFAAKELGCEAHIFLPKFAPLVKQEATTKLGAKIYLGSANLEEAFESALNFSKTNNAHFIPAYNNFDIIIGQATCCYEAIYQLSNISKIASENIDHFVCSIGGGGLAAGAGLVMKALTKGNVVGIEQEFYNSGIKSYQINEQTSADKSTKSTIADGIAASLIGNLNFEYMRSCIEHLRTVSDDNIVQAILGLCEQDHIVAEGAGAAAVADIINNPEFYRGKRVIACVSGGNIDPQLLTRVLIRGLNISGRMLKISLCVSDRPGSLKNLLECVASLDGNVLDLIHDRTYSEVRVGDVEVELSLETRNTEHQQLIFKNLENAGFKPKMRH